MRIKAIFTILIIMQFLAAGYILPAHAEGVRITPLKSVGGLKQEVDCEIVGDVTDAHGNSVNNANVTLKGMGRSGGGGIAVTSLTFKNVKVKDGHFAFKKLSPGRYKLILTEGETGSKLIEEVEVKTGESKQVNFQVLTLPRFPNN